MSEEKKPQQIIGYYTTNKNNAEDAKYTEDLQSIRKTNSKSYKNKTSYHLK